MASDSGVRKFLPYAGKWTAATLSSYDEDVVPEPSLRLDLQKFWESQLIFPYSVDNLVHAFGGPKPSDKSRNSKVLSIFPVYKPCVPRVFISEPYNFSYIKAPNRVFRSAPSLNDQYLGWLDRVQRDKADIWQACGIYDLIQLSRTGLKYQQEMIIAALHFFESSTNTFHFECGMMTPTLLDVAAITGLSPLGDTYDPCKASDTIKFDFRNKSYSKYIVENRKTSDEVSDEEHIAFLTLWLSQVSFFLAGGERTLLQPLTGPTPFVFTLGAGVLLTVATAFPVQLLNLFVIPPVDCSAVLVVT
ncbi:unnamed protein product [Trifolium pratense]|uniref:Uncharacterized protein n=1 Tax=Trifolium pratense TaxID=57577 RepID=A0ACB0KFU4_TRIPR|nr:unnamed protein product [Trifolium pratense]